MASTSRRRFLTSFSVQKSTRVFGTLLPSLQSWPCQKHP